MNLKTTRVWIAPLCIAICVALGLLPLLHFALRQGQVTWPDFYVWRVLRFTLLQATLSTLLSVVPSIIVARALARQHFWGKGPLLALLAVPLSLPVIVAVFGIAAVYGTSGPLHAWITLYGLPGIVLAHVFFNLPLASRLLLESLQQTSAENHRLAAQLNFSDAALFRHVDWPVLKSALPRVAALVFLLCASSFVIVLVFGGPQATTLEVAIYQSLRMDFDVSRALTLTIVQVGLSGLLVWAAAQALVTPDALNSNAIRVVRFDGQRSLHRMIDVMAITALLLLLLPILFSILQQGLFHLIVSQQLVKALCTSLFIAALTCCMALPLAWAMAKAQIILPQRQGLLTAFGLVGYAVPPAVIATGWFLVFRSLSENVFLSIGLIATMNTLMCLPFLLTVLAPALQRAALQHDRLCAQLGLDGWSRMWVIDVPAVRGAVAQSAVMALVLSMGDLTAITLLGSNGLLTLPSLVQQQMGHYQSQQAGGTALVLASICVCGTFLAQRFSRWT